ncbi:hypothetical protein DM860_010012 [Cuscuta australis]|uniref:Chloride channel protein n=1 Tax=Cuscuta australis TaxID=267555 RepID=A0A328D9V0_9ASTE|nr:hypothetical protein DM860_010012 [Cuscuta australis]
MGGPLWTCGWGTARRYPPSHPKSPSIPRKIFLPPCSSFECHLLGTSYSRLRFRIPASGPDFGGSDGENPRKPHVIPEAGEENPNRRRGFAAVVESVVPRGDTAIISACIIGLFTGISVVLFNTAVHEIRDFCWGDILHWGGSWLREESKELIRGRVILVPACGGMVVSLLGFLLTRLDVPFEGDNGSPFKHVVQSLLKTMAACATLGTGNSLGPEGPSVEIGNFVAKGIGFFFDRGAQTKVSLKAAGSAAGISSGFNAAVAGCFFAVESVLWPSPENSSLSLTNTTSMVILSAVVASVVSEIGLGSEPAFAIPSYDFRSLAELPLYLLLGILCGLVSLALSRCTSLMLLAVCNIQQAIGTPKLAFPILGGLSVGLIALAYPEVLYWGFENVDILLESRPLVKGLSVDLLLQLVVVKIVATSICRATGLVGGYYAPSLFIGAAAGMAYGKTVGFIITQASPISHISLDVASPQAYALVGMAATLAGVCQVPLTAVLLLFELTQDYRIVLPLLGAVGMSSWITSDRIKGMTMEDVKKTKDGRPYTAQTPETSVPATNHPFTGTDSVAHSQVSDLNECDNDRHEWTKKTLVSQAMRTDYITVSMNTLLAEVVSLMLAEKQSCALIVDENNLLIGLLPLGDIEIYMKKSRTKRGKDLAVSHLCSSPENERRVLWTVTPNTSLFSAQTLMESHGMNLLPVVLEHGGHPVGFLDRECIDITCRGLEIRDFFCRSVTPEMPMH